LSEKCVPDKKEAKNPKETFPKFFLGCAGLNLLVLRINLKRKFLLSITQKIRSNYETFNFCPVT